MKDFEPRMKCEGCEIFERKADSGSLGGAEDLQEALQGLEFRSTQDLVFEAPSSSLASHL